MARLCLLHVLLFVNLGLILHVNERTKLIVVEYVENLELNNFSRLVFCPVLVWQVDVKDFRLSFMAAFTIELAHEF